MVALPLPVESMLLARDGTPVAWSGSGGALEHADLFDRWLLVDDTPRHAMFDAGLLGTAVGPFVVTGPAGTAPAAGADPADAPLALALSSAYVLGALETALDLAVRYAQTRVQFGLPIVNRQAVGFRLADFVAELYGLQSLLDYTLWRIDRSPHASLPDALALRWYALETARRGLRSAHQVFGAIGLTYEHDLALLSTALQARLRLPLTAPQTLDLLAEAVRSHGFASLFPPDGEPVAAAGPVGGRTDGA